MTETRSIQVAGTDINLQNFSGLNEDVVIKTFLSFIDVANTSTDRATAYNTKDEQRDAVNAIHRNLFTINRGLYGATLLLDGLTDYSKMVGVEKLLSEKDNRESSMLPLDIETNIVIYLLNQLPPQRMLKLYEEIKEKRINNSRTRNIILRTIINSKSLDYWSIKYRRKLRSALEHAWGKRTSSIIASILKRKSNTWDAKEQTIMIKNVHKYIVSNTNEYVYECLSFILGNEKDLNIETLKSYNEAKTNITKGKKLPPEVLEGIRSIYHKNVTKEKVIEVAKDNFTEKEKMKVQTRAKQAGISIAWDPSKQEVVDLYIHAYKTGMSPEVKIALKAKAEDAAKKAPLSYENIGILVDGSNSSRGDSTQELRPIAITLAIRDMLQATAKKSKVVYAGGLDKNDLIYPLGETNLAKPLVQLFKEEPNAIFIISDGYENAPAGRVNEVLHAVRNMGCNIPVYQVTPVMSAESSGIKRLSDKLSVIPANKPSSLGLGMIKAMLESNLQDGIIGLFNLTLPKLKPTKK